MSQAYVHKKFIFNENIDEDHVYGMYEYDYPYIAEVFAGSLDSLNEDTRHFTSAFESADIASLKRTTHKIKPIFGFTGLLHHQEMMARFEHLCETSSGTGNITMQYMEMNELIKEGKIILKEEYNRLTVFLS